MGFRIRFELLNIRCRKLFMLVSILGVFLASCAVSYQNPINLPPSVELTATASNDSPFDIIGRTNSFDEDRTHRDSPDLAEPSSRDSTDYDHAEYYEEQNIEASPGIPMSSLQGACTYRALRNVNCRMSDYPESSLIAILLQSERANLLYLNPTFTHGKFALFNNSQCWIPLDFMEGPSDPLKICQVYVVNAPSRPDLGGSKPPACSSDLDEASCTAAGGTWEDGGAVGASYCRCS